MQTGGPKDKGPLYRQGAYGQGAHTYKGPMKTKDPYRRCVILTHKLDKGPFTDNLRPIQTIGPYIQRAPTDKRPLQTLYNSYRQVTHTDSGPCPCIQRKGPHRPGAGTLTDDVRFIQIRGSHRQMTFTWYTCKTARGSYRKGPIATSKGPYIIDIQVCRETLKKKTNLKQLEIWISDCITIKLLNV